MCISQERASTEQRGVTRISDIMKRGKRKKPEKLLSLKELNRALHEEGFEVDMLDLRQRLEKSGVPREYEGPDVHINETDVASVALLLEPTERVMEMGVVPSDIKYGIKTVPKSCREVFPPVGKKFTVVAGDGNEFEVNMTSKGGYFTGMGRFYREHPEIEPGDALAISKIGKNRYSIRHLKTQ